MKTAGLASLYASVFRVWLDDEDQGLARTMAALDRRLRRGQRSLERLEDVCKGVGRITQGLFGMIRGGFGGAAKAGPGPTASEPPPVQPGV